MATVDGVTFFEPMDLYLEWGDAGVAETKVTLDADAIRAAAPNAVVLWEADA